MKQTHGPVIVNYKEQIKSLYERNLIDVDMNKLMQDRRVDDYHFRTVPVKRIDNTASNLIQNKMLYGFLVGIVENFAGMSADALQRFVYRTKPMLKFKELHSIGRKRDPGGYILDNCLTLKEFKSPVVEGRRLAMEHAEKYPDIDFEQQRKDAEEFAFLEKLRPRW